MIFPPGGPQRASASVTPRSCIWRRAARPQKGGGAAAVNYGQQRERAIMSEVGQQGAGGKYTVIKVRGYDQNKANQKSGV